MKIIVVVGLLILGSQIAASGDSVLRNDLYTLTLQPDHAVKVETPGAPAQTLQPEFTVVFSETDPGCDTNHLNYLLAPRLAIRWARPQEDAAALTRKLNSPDVQGVLKHPVEITDDPREGRVWIYRDAAGKITQRITSRYATGTLNPFAAGKNVVLRATGAAIQGDTLSWRFTSPDDFQFSARLTLPPGKSDPAITFELTPKRAGYYSAGFTGAPAVTAADFRAFPQECTANRLADYLVSEADLRLPRIQLGGKDWSQALVVDPAETPFRLPDSKNARYGLILRREAAQFRPIALAPLLGGAESRLTPGQPYRFTVRYVLRAGDWKETYRHIAEAIYQLRDQRDNSGPGSLNGTLDRVMDYLADRNGRNNAMWVDEQKYYDYWNDNSGTFKPFSPLFGLAAAVVTDDDDFYRRRARPQVEYALSRKNNVFVPYDTPDKGMLSKRSHDLGASYLDAVQLLGLDSFFQDRSPVLETLAQEKGFHTGDLAEMLARAQFLNDPAALAAARRLADAALARETVNTGATYFDLLDLYDATHEPRYLQAAVDGAYGVTTTMNLSPAVPDTTMTIDKGGAPIHAHSFPRHLLWGFPPPQPYPTPEQTVPAWRIALTGLVSDSYRGNYWMNNDGAFLRLACLAQDEFLRTLGRWGMVGRFGNFPGDNRSAYSLVPEIHDLPEHPIWRLSFATVNPGHAWEFAGEIIDFLVSDIFDRSGGRIDFPARAMPGTSFRVRLYGDRPGRFYDETGVRLWLPRGLVTCDNGQVDYLAGYGNGKLYLAFVNQSFRPEHATFTLNPDRVGMTGTHAAKMWEQNAAPKPVTLPGDSWSCTIPAKGIVAYAIDQVPVKTRLQDRMLDPAVKPLGPGGSVQSKTSFGTVHGLLLSMGRGLTSAYIYSEAAPEQVISATLRYRQGNGEWREIHDAIFPYEFSVDLADGKGPLLFTFEADTVRDGLQKSSPLTLTP